MLEPVFSFVLRYKFILLFYLGIIVLLIVYRKRLEIQSKIIILYRTKFGLKFIEKFSRKYRQIVLLSGYIGIGVGFAGLVLISFLLVKNFYDLISKPATASGVSLVLPGINVPGIGILPFWYWLLAIFLIAVIHEFAHGIVARAQNIEIKNTGIVFLGPIIGAFVEPNEEKLKKKNDVAQFSVLAAGAFSNILLAVIALLLLNFLFLPLQQTMVEPAGFTFQEYYNSSLPVAQAAIPLNTVITGLNDKKTPNFSSFNEKFSCLSPGDPVNLTTPKKTYSLILAKSPDNPDKPFLGIKNIKNEYQLKEKYKHGFWFASYYLIDWLTGFLKWLFLLSLGIGLFNLLPLPIVDGGRMLQVYLCQSKGKEKGNRYYRQISLFFLVVLLLNLFYPLIKNLF